MFAMRYRKIGAKIVYFRMLQGLTQEQLAEKVGISPSYLSKIEHGAYPKNLSLTTLLLIAEALTIDICELIKEQERWYYEDIYCVSGHADII